MVVPLSKGRTVRRGAFLGRSSRSARRRSGRPARGAALERRSARRRAARRSAARSAGCSRRRCDGAGRRVRARATVASASIAGRSIANSRCKHSARIAGGGGRMVGARTPGPRAHRRLRPGACEDLGEARERRRTSAIGTPIAQHGVHAGRRASDARGVEVAAPQRRDGQRLNLADAVTARWSVACAAARAARARVALGAAQVAELERHLGQIRQDDCTRARAMPSRSQIARPPPSGTRRRRRTRRRTRCSEPRLLRHSASAGAVTEAPMLRERLQSTAAAPRRSGPSSSRPARGDRA